MAKKITKTPVLTLEIFLSRFMFKEIIVDAAGTLHQSTSTVRIFYDTGNTNHWFDFGMSDFGEELDPLDTVLSPKLLKREIDSFCMDGDKFCIALTGPQKSDEPEIKIDLGTDEPHDA